MKLIQKKLAAAAVTAAGAGAMILYLPFVTACTNGWLMAAVLCMLILLEAVWFEKPNRRERNFGMAFGVVFVILQLCGCRVTRMETIAGTPADFLWLALAAAGLAPAAGGAFVLFVRAMERMQRRVALPGERKARMVFWCSAAILLCCWLPYLLAFYPGLFTYDISWQYEQYQTWNLNTHHPLLHTLMVGWFCDLGWHLFGYPAKGLLMYTMFQMLLMALAMASAVGLLCRHRAPAWVCVLILSAFALLPFHPVLAISSTKDTLFSGAVLYLCVVLMELVLEPDALKRPWWMVRFVLAEAFAGLMRNNGFICIAAVLFAAGIGLVHYRRQAVRLMALALCGLFVYQTASAGLQRATGAQDGHIREMLSVPLQQLARVHALTEDEAKPEIKAWLPTVELYSPHLADLVKNPFQGGKEQLPEVIRLWAEVGQRHPVVYLDSMLSTSAGFYYVGAKPTGQYLDTDFHTDEGRWMVPDSKWPSLHAELSRLYNENGYLNIPVYRAVLSPALWIWLMLLSFWAAICLKNRPVALAGLITFALYLTTLLSPCVMVRYTYPFLLCAPLLLGGLTLPSAKKCN